MTALTWWSTSTVFRESLRQPGVQVRRSNALLIMEIRLEGKLYRIVSFAAHAFRFETRLSSGG